MKTKTTLRVAAAITACLLAAVAIWLSLPSSYYIRRALVHLSPRIDQYPIFENRAVKAGDPKPWPLDAHYNKVSIPPKFEADFEKYGTVAYLIIRRGELLFEEYRDHREPRAPGNSFSMAKTIISLAVGRAIDEGFIRDINQPVSDFFPSFGAFNGEPLTIRHLLTMSAGVDFRESYASLFSPTTRLYYGNDLRSIALGMKQIATPGRQFIYQSGVTQLLALVLAKATGQSVSDYVSRALWTPLQAEADALWSLDRAGGDEKAYCCFNSNARDFARLGQLILDGGKWNGQQLVPARYIQEATTADTSLVFQKHGEPNHNYGYHLWLLEKNGMKIPYLRGILGQYVFVIPDRDAVVVRLGHARDDEETRQHYPRDVDTWLDAALEMLDNAPRSARLVFGGDLMQHLPQLRAAEDGKGGHDYTNSFRHVAPIFRQADLAFLNLETTLAASEYSGYPHFRSPAELANTLRHIGIDAAVLANNHILDAGKKGVTTTLTLLDSAGIRHTGVFTNSLQFIREHPLVLRARGLTFALFNYTYGTNGIPTPDGTRVNRLDSLAIARDIALVDRDKVDAVIVFFHWGDEYARLPDARQRALAELCHLHGAEIVVGSHPHVIQPLVATENRVTVYSLGNLVSNQRERYRDGGIIVTLDVTKEKNRPLSIQTAYTPVWVKLPDYSPLPPPVADTMAMSDTERRAYQQFIADTRQLLSPATNH